jgi:3-hydroxybutyrate dehydrogenase
MHHLDHGGGVICLGFVQTALGDKQNPEQAKLLGISTQEVINNIMLRETVDGDFAAAQEAAEAALFIAGLGSIAPTGQSLMVRQGWFME